MTNSRYIASILRGLPLPRPEKQRVRQELESRLAGRMQAGLSAEQAQADLGPPARVAAALVARVAPGYSRGLAWLRFVYLACAAVPFLYLAGVLGHIFAVPNPGGFSTHGAFFADLWMALAPLMPKLVGNLLLYLLVCALGYLSLRRQIFIGERTLLCMAAVAAVAAIALHPGAAGIETIPMLTPVVFHPATWPQAALWGLAQPQVLLALATVCVDLVLYCKKRAFDGEARGEQQKRDA